MFLPPRRAIDILVSHRYVRRWVSHTGWRSGHSMPDRAARRRWSGRTDRRHYGGIDGGRPPALEGSSW